MARLITYGCSFTNYNWSTWADILADNLKLKLLQRGYQGCGNNFIFARLQDDLKTGVINKNDIIRIMWCYYNRISIFDKPDTFTQVRDTGSMSQKVDNFKNTIKIIKQSQDLLQGFDYDFMTWLPLKSSGQPGAKVPKKIENYQTSGIWYKPIKPSMLDVVFDGDFHGRTDFAVSFTHVSQSILKNIKKLAKLSKITPISLIRQQSRPRDPRYQMFFDLHPTPLMHLEYLQKIYPDITWSADLIQKINQENQRILSTIH